MSTVSETLPSPVTVILPTHHRLSAVVIVG